MTTTLARHDHRAVLTAAAVLLGIAVLLLVVPDALAQQAGGGEDVGKNFGDLLQKWAAQIYLGVVAIVSIVFLINRAYSQLGVFMIAAVVVGMFVVSPESFKNFAGDTAKTLFGS
jgi:drug/metabolite transporter (DMT)-like permease